MGDQYRDEYISLCGLRPPTALADGWSWRLYAATTIPSRDRAWILVAPDGGDVGEVVLSCTSAIAPEFRWVVWGTPDIEGHEDSVVGAAEQLVELLGASAPYSLEVTRG